MITLRSFLKREIGLAMEKELKALRAVLDNLAELTAK